MSETVRLELAEVKRLSLDILTGAGFGARHAEAIANMIYRCQLDDCQSHGLFRLIISAQTIKAGKADGDALPVIAPDDGTAVTRVDAGKGMSLLSVEAAMPRLIEKTREHGVAALAVNRCFHFSALWPEVEDLAAAGLAAMAMVPSHAWVAPAGGSRGTFGTNPFAFAWPRRAALPLVFDFATSAFARGEIELYKRAGKPLPIGVAVDRDGNPTTDPQAALNGAMLTFGGHKGSALSLMIELLAGPMIDDLTSMESMAFSEGKGGAPYHGEILIAFDPAKFNGGRGVENDERAERLFAEILDQGARLPSQRRYEARARNTERGYVEISEGLHQELLGLLA